MVNIIFVRINKILENTVQISLISASKIALSMSGPVIISQNEAWQNILCKLCDI